MFWINTVKSLVQVLQSEDSPMQIAGGVAMGALLGFSPANGLQNLVFFLIVMFINVNLGSVALSTALFALLAALLDPVSHRIGYALLMQTDALTPLWTAWYNMPLLPFTRFYNTVVLGSLVIALAAFVPILFGTRWLVLYYRSHYKDKVAKSGIMKWMKWTKAIDLVEKSK